VRQNLPVHRLELTKPDGRYLVLYGRAPIPAGIEATSPSRDRVPGNPHLRWHPLRGEWVSYASHRQERTFLPPPEYNPLAPTRDRGQPTELPAGAYDAAVFENRFASLSGSAHDPPALSVPTRPATGSCEVVVFTQDPTTSLAALPLWNVELLIEVWADRYRELGRRADVQYVMPFENRGVEVGVTLHHPHGQIYAYPFVPSVPARELEQQRRHLDERGRGLLAAMIDDEVADGRRILYQSADALAFVLGAAAPPGRLAGRPRRGRAARAGAGPQDGPAEVRAALGAAVPVPDGLPPGADRRPAAPGGARPHRAVPALPDAGATQVPGRDRDRRRHVRERQPAGGQGGRAAGGGGRA
jgi:galactose-1-phosphate uridylyltransferase-like protein